MAYELGKKFECEIKGEAKEDKFDYPIPDMRQNMYELERMFTRSYDVEDRAIKRRNDDDY